MTCPRDVLASLVGITLLLPLHICAEGTAVHAGGLALVLPGGIDLHHIPDDELRTPSIEDDVMM